MTQRVLILGLALSALSFFSCDGGTGSNDGSPGDAGLTARLDGKSWKATPISIVAQVNAGVTGSLSILGTQTDGDKTLSLTLLLYNVGGPGKYALGVSSSGFGGSGLVGEGYGGGDADSWITPSSGTAGEVDIIAIGDGRVRGTFYYTAEPGKDNTAGGKREVTDGHFDLPLTGTLKTLAENAGSRVTAKLNGIAYNAATVYGSLADFTGGAGLTFSSTNDSNALSLNLVGITETGTYSLRNTSPSRLLTAGRNGGDENHCCWGTMADDSGEVVVTSLTAKRARGTFTATLKPQNGKPAKADLVITEGSFDIGMP